MIAIVHLTAKGAATKDLFCKVKIVAFGKRLLRKWNLIPSQMPVTNDETGRHKESINYKGVFLGKRAAVVKRQTYISAALFTKITEITAVIANNITLPTFLDNVLEHHLETYKDEINELYEIKTKKPL